MSTSGIDYVSHSWGPWRGCSKVSAGCLNCYAERDMKRYGKDFSTVTRASQATFNGPRSLTKYPPGSWVFVCPWSDFWHAAADQWRVEALDIIRGRQDLTFVIPTKRTERIVNHTDDGPLDNVIVLASAENQAALERQIPGLLAAKEGWGFRVGLSVEPMLGPLDLTKTCINLPMQMCGLDDKPYMSDGDAGIDWVVCGAESGPEKRFCDRDWVRSLRDQCAAVRVPFFYKQGPSDDIDWRKMPMLDGRVWDQRPEAQP